MLTKVEIKEQILQLLRDWFHEATVKHMVAEIMNVEVLDKTPKQEEIETKLMELSEKYYWLLDSDDWKLIRTSGALIN